MRRRDVRVLLYDRLSDRTVWDVAEQHLPHLRVRIQTLLVRQDDWIAP